MIGFLKWWFWDVCESVRIKYYRIRGFKVIGGRHIDFIPMMCHDCGWIGPTRWAVHTYEDDGSGEDVEPVDECPKCGSQELWNAEMSRKFNKNNQ